MIWGAAAIFGLMDPQLTGPSSHLCSVRNDLSSSLHKVIICSLFGLHKVIISSLFGDQLQYMDWWIHSSLVLLPISAQSGLIWAPAFTRWAPVLYLGRNYNIWIDGSTAELQPSQSEHLFFIWGSTAVYGLINPQLTGPASTKWVYVLYWGVGGTIALYGLMDPQLTGSFCPLLKCSWINFRLHQRSLCTRFWTHGLMNPQFSWPIYPSQLLPEWSVLPCFTRCSC